MPRDRPMMSPRCSHALFWQEASHSFAGDGDALSAQFRVNAWTAVHLSTGVIDSVSVLCQQLLFPLMLTPWAVLPGIGAAQGDTKLLTQHTDRIPVSQRFHGLIPHCWSREKMRTVYLVYRVLVVCAPVPV